MSTYTELLADIQNWFEDDGDEFVADIPRMITNAELRIHKRIPNHPAYRTLNTGTLTAGTATVAKGTLRSTRFLRLTVGTEEIHLLPRTDSYIIDMYPNSSKRNIPKYFAEDDENNYRFGPTPDGNYPYTAGVIRMPTGLSESNANTEIGDDYEDLMLYASMMEGALYLEHDEGLIKWKAMFDEEMALVASEVTRIYVNEYGSA